MGIVRPIALAAALGACGGGGAQVSPPRPPAGPLFAATVTTAVERPPPAPRSTRLSFELNGRPFPLPVLHATVAGEPAWMLVDTGANSHVLASWMARKAGLPTRALGALGSDHTGRPVIASTLEHAPIVLDGWGPLPEGPMLVADVPGPVEEMGLAGFVSPQWLGDEGGAVVLDLAAGEMHTASWAEAIAALDARAGAELVERSPRLCRHDESVIRGLAYVVRGSVEGHGVDLLLDTGAIQTDLLTTSPAGRALSPRATPARETMYTASGVMRATVVHGAAVRIGGWAVTSDVDLVPGVADPTCPRDGVVSMDALRACTLVLGRGALRARCGP